MTTIKNTRNPVPETSATPPATPKPYLTSRHVRSYAALCEQAGIVFDMTDTPTFSSDYDKAPLPVLIHYGAKPLHRVILPGTRWHEDKLRSDLRGALIRGDTAVRKDELARRDMIFGTRQGTFVHYDGGRISVFAATPRRAMLAALRFERYVDHSLPEKPSYQLLKQSRNGMETQEVELKDIPEIDNETLALHYGSAFPGTARNWKNELPPTAHATPQGHSSVLFRSSYPCPHGERS